MLEKLNKNDLVEINNFNKDVLKRLAKYFDLNTVTGTKEEHFQFFENLLVLAKHSLGVAHCVQHYQSARSLMQGRFQDKYPDWYDPEYGNMIGCFSSHKKADAMVLNGRTVSGTKHWISMVHQSDYGFFRVKMNNSSLMPDVLIDFKTVRPLIGFENSTTIGMEIAKAGSITIHHYELPESCIFMPDTHVPSYSQKSGVSFGFSTNLLGIIMGLFKDFEDYINENNINVNFEHKKMSLAISSLTMHWRNNMPTTLARYETDELWHQHHTQYTISKNVLLDLIHLVLQVCDSRWVDARSARSQRLRDALTFCAHMRPLQNNVTEHTFLRF